MERAVAWSPIDDPVRTPASDPGSVYGAGARWTPFGLTLMGHEFSVNLGTGGLIVGCIDLSMSYHTGWLRVQRRLNAQEHYAQTVYLDTHPNTDPRPHFFGNWQFQREAYISPVWDSTLGELLVADGKGDSFVFYRAYPGFQVNAPTVKDVEDELRSQGIPGRTLSALGWKYSPFDYVLRTRQGSFAVLAGHFEPETLMDSADVRLWAFDPLSGMTRKFTSEYAYDDVELGGARETTVPTLLTEIMDALGHNVSFHPVDGGPPYAAYRLSDGAGRSLRLELNDFVTYPDGNRPGSKVKTRIVTRVVDEIRGANNVIEYGYEKGRLSQVVYPGLAGKPARVVKYDYDGDGNLVRITDPVGDTIRFAYKEDLLDSDELLIPRSKVAKIEDSAGNSVEYQYDHPNRHVRAIVSGPGQPPHVISYEYLEDEDDTGQRYITSERIDVTPGLAGNQTIESHWVYSEDGRFLIEKSIDPLGNTSADEYNDFNLVTATIDATGHRREFKYDLQNVPTPAQPNRFDLVAISETNVDAKDAPQLVSSSQQFERYSAGTSNDPTDVADSTHRISVQTDELGNVSSFSFDDKSNFSSLQPSQRTDPLGKSWLRGYDDQGNLVKATDPTGVTGVWTYNKQGQLLSYTDPNGFERFWVHDLGT